jgi:4-hydroxybenzoate polyprenyltransferase
LSGKGTIWSYGQLSFRNRFAGLVSFRASLFCGGYCGYDTGHPILTDRYTKRGEVSANRLLAVLAAVLALAITFCLSVIATAELLQLVYASKNSADRSVGDTVGWAMIFISPVLLPVSLVLSIAVAAAAYHFVLRFRNLEKDQRHRHK